MKIIHTADIHLGSSFSNLSKEERKQRNLDVLNTFNRLVEYAKQNGVNIIMLAGDIFDTKERQFARLQDKKAFEDIVANNHNINFLYLKGNHDNMKSEGEKPDNLLTFNDKEWTRYDFGNVTIAGIEFGADSDSSIYESLCLDSDRFNIVMMHGQNTLVKDSRRELKESINLHALQNRNIDYLALGHIHSYQQGEIDKRGVWAYSGCLMGRGFDEAGDKGFILIDTDAKTIDFVPFAEHKVIIKSIDISDATNAQAAWGIVSNALNDISNKQNHMLKVELTGEISFDPVNERLTETINNRIIGFFFHKVDDKTRRKYSFSEFIGQNSLPGEFVSVVMSDDTLDEDTKNKIMNLGLSLILNN